MSTRAPLPSLADFAHTRDDLMRLADLDFQQHVNNNTFGSLLSSARYDFLGEHVRPHIAPGAKLVVARTEIDYRGELAYRGTVTTGTRVLSFGRTSLRLEQAIFQNGRCAATALTVMVHVGAESQAGEPWSQPVLALVNSAS